MRSLLSLLALLSAPALAAPGYVPIQGLLTDSSGVAVDGQVDVTFTLYTDSTGGTSLWQDTLTLDVIGGRFAAELGGNLPLDLDTFANYPNVHLQIQVSGDSAMPLVPLDTVPYAAWSAKAADASTLEGVSLAGLRAEIPAVTDIEDVARNVAFDSEAELTALLNDNYVYTAGTGIAISGNRIAVDQATVEGWANGVDDDTTYLPGAGLSLSGTTFSVDQATIEGWAYHTEAELTAALDDNYLSQADLESTTFTDFSVSGSIENLAPWGLNAKLQGLVIMPEGEVYDDGAGNLTLASDVIIMNPASQSWVRVNAGTYSLGSWSYLYIDLPASPDQVYLTPQVGTWNSAVQDYATANRIVLAQRQGLGDIFLNFSTPVSAQQKRSLTTSVIRGLADRRLSAAGTASNHTNAAAGTWVDLVGRSLAITKRRADSALKITYQDTLGSRSYYYTGCEWRIVVDGTTVLDFSTADQDTPSADGRQWRMENASHTAWATGFAAGAHTVKVQWRGDRGAWTATDECLAGWNTSGNFLMVEEIE